MKTVAVLTGALFMMACAGGGPSGGGRGGSNMSKLTQGSGQITFKGNLTSTKWERFQLSSNSSHGSVYCELTPKGWGVIALGSFSKMSSGTFGINISAPIQGLAFTVADMRSAGSKTTDQAWVNVDNGSVSSPHCTYFPEPSQGGVLKGSIQCTDREDRNNWGRMTVSASFTCAL